MYDLDVLVFFAPAEYTLKTIIFGNQEERQMHKPINFFKQKHLQLWRIAGWASIMAWLALAVNILFAISQLLQFQDNADFRATTNNPTFQISMVFLSQHPYDLFKLGINVAAAIISGFVYYLVLKGVSLGLNMIVETDINYREIQIEDDEQ
jgi:hypothetical protein